MTGTPYDRERSAVILLRDHGPLILDAESIGATNEGGFVALATVHALERKLLVRKSGRQFVLTPYGATTAAGFSPSPSKA